MRRLDNWLTQSQSSVSSSPPDASGIWGDIFDNIYRLHKREKKEKEQLQILINRIQKTTAALKDGVIVLDKHACIEWWNQSARVLVGLQPNDTGQPLSNYIRSPKFIQYFEREEFQDPLIIPSPVNPEAYLMLQVSLYGNGEYLFVIRDISRVQKLENMRKDFIGNVSHELRTPLTVIRGYLETMEDNAESLKPVWRKAVAQMQQQTHRMRMLIEDLLTLTKLETENNEHKQVSVNIPELLSIVCEDAQDLSGDKQHTIDLIINDSFALHGVDSELRSCFSNLVFNAVRYSPAGSKITVTAFKQGQKASVSVKDNGAGIEAKHIPRLTERFYRVDDSRSAVTGGTGLGLAIVKHALSRHNGILQIKSKLNQGSTFTCSFDSSRIVRAKHSKTQTVAN